MGQRLLRGRVLSPLLWKPIPPKEIGHSLLPPGPPRIRGISGDSLTGPRQEALSPHPWRPAGTFGGVFSTLPAVPSAGTGVPGEGERWGENWSVCFLTLPAPSALLASFLPPSSSSLCSCSGEAQGGCAAPGLGSPNTPGVGLGSSPPAPHPSPAPEAQSRPCPRDLVLAEAWAGPGMPA